MTQATVRQVQKALEKHGYEVREGVVANLANILEASMSFAKVNAVAAILFDLLEEEKLLSPFIQNSEELDDLAVDVMAAMD